MKPEGVYTHGYGHARHRKSLTHIISRLVAPSKEPDALKKPAPAHRLDKKTGGLIVFVKTLRAAQGMREQFDLTDSFKKRFDRALDGPNLADAMAGCWNVRCMHAL
jgi:23S rRNA-/tRNA-specific pseudouridylate synthase